MSPGFPDFFHQYNYCLHEPRSKYPKTNLAGRSWTWLSTCTKHCKRIQPPQKNDNLQAICFEGTSLIYIYKYHVFFDGGPILHHFGALGQWIMIDNLLPGGGLKHVFIYTPASGDDPICLLCFKWIETKGMCILYFVVSLGKIYVQKRYPPTHPKRKCKYAKTNKNKQNQTTSPCFCCLCCSVVPFLFFPTLLWLDGCSWGKGIPCWSRNWTAWKLILGFLIKRSQKKSLPDLADILGQPQEDLAVSFNEMCQYCSCQPRFPTLFAVTWREAASENLCGSVKMMLKRKPMMLRCSWPGSNVDRIEKWWRWYEQSITQGSLN